jgi:hypothetical protein
MTMTTQRFEFAFDPRFRALLLGFGVTPGNSSVTVSDDRVEVRFGPWVCATQRDNIAGVERSGPYRWYRAIGVRISLADRGLTFGSTAAGGVCIRFREPVKSPIPGPLRHPGLTVTVQDRGGLAALLEPTTP